VYDFTFLVVRERLLAPSDAYLAALPVGVCAHDHPDAVSVARFGNDQAETDADVALTHQSAEPFVARAADGLEDARAHGVTEPSGEWVRNAEEPHEWSR